MRDAPTLNIVLAGGGTGGHIQPAVATIHVLREKVSISPVWIGSRTGIEQSVAERENIPFKGIQTGKLRRYFSLQTPIDAIRIPVGMLQAYRHLRTIRPHVVFSTGGFVSVPTVVAARALGIPSISHEQTAIAGLATRINAQFCDVVALSHESSARFLGRNQNKAIVTGNPIRPEILNANPDDAYNRFGMKPELPLIYVTGGAQGAQAINRAIEQALSQLLKVAQIIHQCGPVEVNGDETRLRAARERLSAELQTRYVVMPYVGTELGAIYAAASLVIGRAGAGTVAELAALGKPSILIPLPNTGGDEQTINAQVLTNAGASVMIPQHELSDGRLESEVKAIINDRDLQDSMATSALKLGRRDAAQRLAQEILALSGHRPSTQDEPRPSTQPESPHQD